MIYLITGVPGSGKSLYAVSTLLQKLMKEVVKGNDGKDIKRRLCVDGVPDLVLPHELMASRPEVSRFAEVSKQAEPIPDGHGLWNWFQWCKPGDILFVDEVQRHWRPRGMGTKPPAEIAMLETHRHLGVDLVLVTQNAMLLDQNVRRLVGRHLHVRRIFGGGRALIYDWDGCQTDTHRTQGSTKTYWSYPKDAYKLYKSSELHTKQHQKIPIWFAFPLVVVALGIFAGPKAYSVMSNTLGGKGIGNAPVASAKPLAAASGSVGSVKSPAVPGGPAPVASFAVPAVAVVPKVRQLGCIVFKDRCECFDGAGDKLDVELDVCLEGSVRVGYVVPSTASAHPAVTPVPSSLRTAEPASVAAASGRRTEPLSAGGLVATHKAGIVP